MTVEHEASDETLSATVDKQLTEMTTTVTEWTEDSKARSEDITSWTEEMEESVEGGLKRVEGFLTRDLKEDVPTGWFGFMLLLVLLLLLVKARAANQYDF